VNDVSRLSDYYTYTRSKKISPKWDGLSYSTTQKSKETGKMPLPSLVPIPLKNVEFSDGTGLRLYNSISPGDFAVFFKTIQKRREFLGKFGVS